MIAITICSTKSYSYALIAQARKIQACIEREPRGVVILVGDDSPEIREAQDFYTSILPQVTDNIRKSYPELPEKMQQAVDDGWLKRLPDGWSVETIIGNFEDGLENYKNPAQLVIARMRSKAFDRARQLNVDLCWSIDSDVLPPPNALRVMKQMLEFDDGYYAISTCPYPSQGGGAFLGGRGTPEHPILPDFYDDERQIPGKLKKRMSAHRALGKSLQGNPDREVWKKWHEERAEIGEEVKKCKPVGNVFHCNSKRFRRRGWMEAAYPGIGVGAVVPSDWCGFGCTLMSKRALSLAQFDGYDGSGTEDLYVVWKRWYRNGLKINVIPHAPCDHVIRKRDNPKEFMLCQAYHESKDPECVGHLRMEFRPWYQQVDGEKYAQPA